MGSFKKVCILHNGIFPHIFLVKLGQFYSIIFPVIVTKNKKLKAERKEDIFAYMTVSVYHVTSNEIENHLFRHNWSFRHTCMYKKLTLTVVEL